MDLSQQTSKVYCVFPATGKTYLANSHPDRYVEIHDPGQKNYALYVDVIEQRLKDGYTVLAPTYSGLIDELIKREIDVTLVYPTAELRDHYLERMRSCGGSREYLSGMERAFVPGVSRLDRVQGVDRILITDEHQFLSHLPEFTTVT